MYLKISRSLRLLTIFQTVSLGLLCLLLFCCGCKQRDVPTGSNDAIGQDMYIWQRAWNDNLHAALQQSSHLVERYAVLAAEVDLQGDRPQVVYPDLYYDWLQETGRDIVLCIRINGWSGPFVPEHPVSRFIGGVIREAVARAEVAGAAVVELQFDFDCPESKLAGYRRWLRFFRHYAGKRELTFTALPSWLSHKKEMQDLADAADGFVLQVHSLQEKTGGGQVQYILCEPEAARRWVEQAGELQKPFRVALPSYGYRLLVDEEGRLEAVNAEDVPATKTPGQQVQLVRADWNEMAGLLETWRRKRPAKMQGISWYRMPVQGDRLGWPLVQLEAVMTGREPIQQPVMQIQRDTTGLIDLILNNKGETILSRCRFEIAWPLERPVELLTADGVNGFSLDGGKHGLSAAASLLPDSGLMPGEGLQVAWLRFAEDTEVEIENLECQ